MQNSFLCILKDLQQNRTSEFGDFNSEQVYHFGEQENNQQIHGGQFLESLIDPRYHYVEYVPFKRRILDFQQREYRVRVPMRRREQYVQDRKVYETIPRQKTMIDYYAVQHIRYYQKQIIPQKSIQYVPVVRTVKKLEYIPVQRKIVHYPKNMGIDQVQTNGLQSFSGRKQYFSNWEQNELNQNKIFLNLQSKNRKQSAFDSDQVQYSPINSYKLYEKDSQIDTNSSQSVLNSLRQAYEKQQM